MAKTMTKSPKPKPKFPVRSSKNGEKDDKQAKGKVGINKLFRKDKKQVSTTPVKIPSLESAKKKKLGEKKRNLEQNDVVLDKQEKGKWGFGKPSREGTKPITKFSSVESAKKKTFGEKKRNLEHNDVVLDKQGRGKWGLNKQSREGTKPNTTKFSSLESAKRNKFGSKTKNSESNWKNNDVLDKQAKGKVGFNKQFREEKKQSTRNPERVSSSGVGKNKLEENTKTPLNSSLESAKRMKKQVEYDPATALMTKPKRTKKMAMKIDPYDTSNKRLDDGIVLNDITNQHKKEELEKEPEKVELSMNAQFRAIKPSPSIITFVQENLLGRRRDIELRKAGYNIELSAPLDNIPFSTCSERERIEESLFRNKLDFFAAAKVSSSFPPPDLPEIAFAGRSNVGKSSLLNALTRQWGVVRTSDKPGLTQTINFFKLGTKVNLVDLPGYGFAYAKEEVKEAWEELVKEYVSTRVGLKRVCLLVDTKWGIKPRDIELIHLMEKSQTNYQIVLTKTDTVFPLDVARRAMQVEETLKQHKSVVQPVMMVSSKSGAGIRCLRTALATVARFLKP